MPTSEGVQLNAADWRSLHPILLLFGVGRIFRGYLPLLLIWLVTGNLQEGMTGVLPYFILVGLCISTLRLVAIYLSFRYQTEGGHIHIREGIFSRSFRSIPIHRIHNLNLKQTLIGRIFGIVQLEIETAGAAGAEAQLPTLRVEEAERIQAFVREGQARFDSENCENRLAQNQQSSVTENADSQLLYQIRTWDLFIAGATSTKLSVLLVMLAVFFQYAQDYAPGTIDGKWLNQMVTQMGRLSRDQPFLAIAYGLLLFAAMLLVSWMIGVVVAFVRWFGFRLTRRGHELQIQYGLFNQQRNILSDNKVQALRFLISVLRRPFDLLHIHVISAGQIGSDPVGKSDANLLVPITRGSRATYFIQSIWPEARWNALVWKEVHLFHRNRLFFIKSVFLLFVSLAIYLLVDAQPLKLWLIGIVLAMGIPGAFFISNLTYRQTAYAVDGSFLYIKSGFLALKYWVIPRSKIQNIRLRQTPFQRSNALANLELDLAGVRGEQLPTIPNISLKEAWLLFNLLGHVR